MAARRHCCGHSGMQKNPPSISGEWICSEVTLACFGDDGMQLFLVLPAASSLAGLATSQCLNMIRVCGILA